MAKVKLGEVAKEIRETFGSETANLPAVGLEHLTPENMILANWDERKENTFTKIFRKGQVLFGRRRAYLKKAAIAPFDGICSGDISVFEAIPDKLLSELLPFVIQNDKFFDFAMEKSAGSLSPRAKWDHLQYYEFNLPTLSEQKKLTELLWAINSTKETYKKLLSLADELVKSQFVEMFGNVFAESEKFAKRPIFEIVEAKISKVSKTFVASNIIRYIDISSIDNEQGKIVQYTDFMVEAAPSRAQQVVKQGDVLISTVRPNLKNVAVVKDDYDNMVASTGFCILRPRHCTNTEFLYALVSTSDFVDYLVSRAKGANYPAVNGSDILNFEIPIPPLSLQNEFAAFVEQVDKSKFAVQNLQKVMLKLKIFDKIGLVKGGFSNVY